MKISRPSLTLGLALFSLLLGLSACQPSAQAPASSDSKTESAAPAQPVIPPLSAADIVGEWRIAGVNGGEINQPTGITAQITADEIRITSGCVNLAFGYRLAAGQFAATQKPVAGCERTLSPAEKAVGDAVNKAQSAARDSSNALVLSGEGSSLTLYTQ